MISRQRINAQAFVSAKQSENTSCIDELYQQGSARIRFPRLPRSEQRVPLQAVLLNTAGGLTGDDQIHWQATATERSHLCLSTAACEKIYRSHGPAANQTTTLHVAKGARLDWLPQEAILFDGANLERTLTVTLEDDAEVLLMESLVFGRQAMQEHISKLSIHDRWRVYRQSRLLHAEDFRLNVNDTSRAQLTCVMHQYRAISTLVLINNRGSEWQENTVKKIRQLAKAHQESLSVGASVLPHRLVIRVLANDSYQLRKFLIPCVAVINDGRPVPTVWNV